MNKRGVTVSPKTAEILEHMGEQIKLARNKNVFIEY